MKHKGFTIYGGKIVPLLSIAVCAFFLYHLKENEMIGVVVFLTATTILYLGLNLFKKTGSYKSELKIDVVNVEG